jgi:uncharacterized DUF497 family protein
MGCPGCAWDPRKDIENQRKHGIAFEDACCVFEDPNLTVLPDDRDYGEARWIAIGRFEWRVLVVVFTDRNGRERIISARRARRDEEKLYFEKAT